MSIRGEIETMPLPDLFQWLALKGKTGILALIHGNTAQKFYLSEGLIASAVSTPYPVSRNERGIRELLSETLYWNKGRFDFSESPLPEEALTLNLKLDTQQIVIEILKEPGQTAPAAKAMAAAVGSSPSTPSQAVTLVEGLRLAIFDRLVKGKFKLPLLPTVASKVMEITQRENYSLRDLSNVILTDQVIAAQVLKQANSLAFGGGREIDSMPLALQRLGSETITNIVFALSLQSMSSGRDLFLPTKKRLWEHSSACALLARNIALPVQLDHNLAFLCALMMDFGKIVLLSIVQDLMTTDRANQKTPAEAVNEVIEAYHPKAGNEVGRKWQLPAPVLEAMTYHHNLTAAGEHRAYAAVASFSDVLVTAFTPASNPQTEDSSAPTLPTVDELAQDPAARLLNLSTNQVQAMVERVLECLEAAQGFLVK